MGSFGALCACEAQMAGFPTAALAAAMESWVRTMHSDEAVEFSITGPGFLKIAASDERSACLSSRAGFALRVAPKSMARIEKSPPVAKQVLARGLRGTCALVGSSQNHLEPIMARDTRRTADEDMRSHTGAQSRFTHHGYIDVVAALPHVGMCSCPVRVPLDLVAVFPRFAAATDGLPELAHPRPGGRPIVTDQRESHVKVWIHYVDRTGVPARHRLDTHGARKPVATRQESAGSVPTGVPTRIACWACTKRDIPCWVPRNATVHIKISGVHAPNRCGAVYGFLATARRPDMAE